MLTFAEELILLALDHETGRFKIKSNSNFHLALAGSILMNLALMDKIDTDLEKLMVVDGASTGVPVFDKVLDMLIQSTDLKSTAHWVDRISQEFPNLRESFIDSLVKQGILEERKQKVLGIFKQHRYFISNPGAKKEITGRIRNLVLNSDIPDPCDIVLVVLVKTSDLIDKVFAKEELEEATKRIYQISQMDLIGQAVTQAIIRAMISHAAYMSY